MGDQNRRKFSSLGLVAFGLAASIYLSQGAPTNLVENTRTTLQKWVEVRQLIGRTKADWINDKDVLQQSINLYQRELSTLAEQMTSVQTNSTAITNQRVPLEKEKAELKAANERLKVLLGELEAQVRAVTNLLPAPLLSSEGMQKALELIPADSNNTRIPVNVRMGTLVNLLIGIAKFNTEVTLHPETQVLPDGAEIQVTRIYLGLGQAYFVDRAGTFAGLGWPTPEGWHWETRNELASAIQDAIAIYDNTKPAVFLSLPAQIH